MTIKGIIKVVEQSAVHDGPGLRSLVFLKGCALSCKWCQNPELIDPHPEIWIYKFLCKGCGECEKVCPAGAIDLKSEKRVDRNKCLGISCSKCVEVCPHDAMRVVGYEITAEGLFQHVAKFQLFYDHSDNGGVTITGGEPLYQAEFTAEVLRLCRTRGIHTAIESSLFAKYDDLSKVADHCSLILCDVKHMDSEKHREGTGASNELILDNLKRLNQDFNNDIVVRIPLVPGYNDDEDNINKTLEFLCSLKQVKGVDLLLFNVFPSIKYEALSLDWHYKGVETQPDKHIEKLREIADSYKSLKCSVGGLW
jgi:pyruvate formate lyase activating enzyme